MQDDEKLSDLPPSRTKAVVGRLSVTEERLAVRIEEREAGSVRVRTVTHKELKEVPVVLQSTSIHVDRVPVYRFVDAEFEPRQEGDTLIVPVFEYVPVTEMRLMLKEEIRVKSTVTFAGKRASGRGATPGCCYRAPERPRRRMDCGSRHRSLRVSTAQNAVIYRTADASNYPPAIHA